MSITVRSKSKKNKWEYLTKIVISDWMYWLAAFQTCNNEGDYDQFAAKI